MAQRFQEWATNLLGFQSVAQFGAQQVQLQNTHGFSVDCEAFIGPRPVGFEATSLAMIRDNAAVVPIDWISSGIGRLTLLPQSTP